MPSLALLSPLSGTNSNTDAVSLGEARNIGVDLVDVLLANRASKEVFAVEFKVADRVGGSLWGVVERCDKGTVWHVCGVCWGVADLSVRLNVGELSSWNLDM